MLPSFETLAALAPQDDGVRVIVKSRCYKMRRGQCARLPKGSPADFATFIAEFTDKWRKVIRAAGIKGE